MSKVDKTSAAMDENTRRYYLDAMGIQCWQSLTPATPNVVNALSTAPEQGAVNEHQAISQQSISQQSAALNYSHIEQNIQHCQQCELHNHRKQALSGRGDLAAKLMFLVLSPNKDDENSCTLCSGEAGALFKKMLAAIDIDIKDVYLSSLLKCTVPENHTITPAEIRHCNQHLQQQIQLIQPKILIVLGETAVRCLLQQDLCIDDFRALNKDLSQPVSKSASHRGTQFADIPLLVSYSPQELLLHPEHKRKAWHDLQQLQSAAVKINSKSS